MTVLAFAYLYHKGMLHLKEQQMHLWYIKTQFYITPTCFGVIYDILRNLVRHEWTISFNQNARNK
jgi:hypothetical protein